MPGHDKTITRDPMSLYHSPELLTPWFQTYIRSLWEKMAHRHGQFGSQISRIYVGDHYNHNCIATYRPLVKSAYQKNNFLISQPKLFF